jgi:copper chaperone NosL
MHPGIDRFYRSLDRPLRFRSRFVLGALVVPLSLAFTAPLWVISMEAPQYPAGLALEIFPHTVDGDVAEVNTLNHYIGMQTIDRASLSDLDWIPFGLGLLVLLCLRVAAIGDVRSLADLFVLFLYFSLFSMARFAYRLYVFGHELDPKAPFQVDPFTPAILGTKEVANFTITSLPGGGTAWIAAFGLGLVWVVAWNLRASWRATKPLPAG